MGGGIKGGKGGGGGGGGGLSLLFFFHSGECNRGANLVHLNGLFDGRKKLLQKLWAGFVVRHAVGVAQRIRRSAAGA